MNVYRPRKFAGGNVGRVFQSVAKTAKTFARTKLAKALGSAAKKEILQAGSQAVDKMLSGQPVAESIKTAASALNTQLTPKAKKGFKRVVLGRQKPKRRLVGGLKLYRLRKRFPANKKNTVPLYRLNNSRRTSQPLYRLKNRRKTLQRLKAIGRFKGKRFAYKKKSVKKSKKFKKIKKRKKNKRKKKTPRKRVKRTQTSAKKRKRTLRRAKKAKKPRSRKRKPIKRLRTVFDL